MWNTIARAYDLVRRGGLGPLLRAVTRSYLPAPADRWASLVQQEVRTRSLFPMPMRERLWLYRRGFLSQARALYEFGRHDPRQYLSDYARYVRTPRINGRWAVALDNKLVFHWMMQPFDDYRPDLYGLIESGTVHRSLPLQVTSVDESSACSNASTVGTDPGRWVLDRLRDEGALVIKPVTGGGGENVLVCDHREGEYRVNDEPRTADEFRSLIRDLDGYLVFEFVEPAGYATELFPDTANTIRILTLFPEDASEPFIAASVHRIGTTRSEGLDNWSRGGLSADIDRDTGRLSRGVQYPYSGQLEWCTTHPDTGSRIEGTQVPGWTDITDRLLEIASEYPYLPYVGWDLIVTDPGEFTIIEANSYTDIDLLQVHTPLLEDPRARRFYATQRVI